MAQTVTFLPLNGFRSRSGLLRFPTDQRELLQMLGMLETSAAPDAVLDRIDLFGARPAHVYHVAHRRLPDSIEAAMAAVGYDARAALAAAVTSDEFRANVVLNLLHAWPELGRSVVLGVPGVRLDGMFTALAKEQSVLRDWRHLPARCGHCPMAAIWWSSARRRWSATWRGLAIGRVIRSSL